MISLHTLGQTITLMPVIFTLNVQMGRGGLAKPSSQPKMGELPCHLLETGLGKGPDEGKPVTIWAVRIATPAHCWLENKPASSWIFFRTFHHWSEELQARWKTPWSLGAPLKGGGIKVGLLGTFFFFLIHHSRHKAGTEEDAGEINWKSLLGSI